MENDALAGVNNPIGNEEAQAMPISRGPTSEDPGPSSQEQYFDAIDSTVYAEVDPCIVLRQQEDRLGGSFHIHNITSPLKPIMYKVMALHPTYFHVNPIIGKIGPNETGRIFVKLLPQMSVNSDFASRFLVRIIPVSDEPATAVEQKIVNFDLLNNYYKELERNANPEKHYILATLDLEPQFQAPPAPQRSVQQVLAQLQDRVLHLRDQNSTFSQEFRKWIDRWPYILAFLLVIIFAILWYQNKSTSGINSENNTIPTDEKVTRKGEILNNNITRKEGIIMPCLGDII